MHALYGMNTRAMREIPAAALPRLPSGTLSEVSKGQGIVTARDDSPPLPVPSAEILNDFSGRRGIRTPDFVRVKDALYR
jgi:hypothetical protein